MGICDLPATLCEGGNVLTDGQAFLWRQRLRQERARRNITDLHVRILDFTQGAIEAGADEMSHATVAEALGVSVRVVGDTYRRAKGIGLLEWDAQFRNAGGVRRRTVNRYRLTMPDRPAEQSPDMRRKPVFKSHLTSSSLPYSSAQCAEPVVTLEAVRAAWPARQARLLAAFRRGPAL